MTEELPAENPDVLICEDETGKLYRNKNTGRFTVGDDTRWSAPYTLGELLDLAWNTRTPDPIAGELAKALGDMYIESLSGEFKQDTKIRAKAALDAYNKAKER